MLPYTFPLPYPRASEPLEVYIPRLIRELHVMYESIVREFGSPIEELFTWDVGQLLPNGMEVSDNIPLPGATPGDFVEVSADIDLQGLILTAYVYEADVVRAVVQNPNTGNIDLGTATFRVRVRRAFVEWPVA